MTNKIEGAVEGEVFVLDRLSVKEQLRRLPQCATFDAEEIERLTYLILIGDPNVEYIRRFIQY